MELLVDLMVNNSCTSPFEQPNVIILRNHDGVNENGQPLCTN